MGLVGVQVNNQICSPHDIAEILLKLALSTNQSINLPQCMTFIWIDPT